LAAVRYRATIGAAGGGTPRVVDIEEKAGVLHLLLDGVPHQVDAIPLADDSVSLILDGRSYALEFEPRGGGERTGVLLRGSVFEVELLDERRLRMRAAGGRLSDEGPQVLVAPMPGKIVRVLVRPGDEVREGQGLLVVEAMKMENELRAARAGRVLEVAVVEGAAVEAGARLCVVA
jgi:acetyl/propionyl-CoA carboxylase alpha subunit